MDILAATGNPGKIVEIRRILEGQQEFRVLTAADVGGVPDVIEDGDSFADNAINKALTTANAVGMPTLADDSGLVVTALDGAPGVFSARYAGPEEDSQRNVAKLLQALTGVIDRTAAFVCTIAVARPGEVLGTADGRVSGRIITAPRGRSGFGYDPVFVPTGYDLTFAEMGSEDKNRISHRAEALRNAQKTGLFQKLLCTKPGI